MTNIEYITSPMGDWVVVKVNGEVQASGHSISDSMWLSMLEEYASNVDVKSTEISDEDMEEGNY